jgi:hypothetical protein
MENTEIFMQKPTFHSYCFSPESGFLNIVSGETLIARRTKEAEFLLEHFNDPHTIFRGMRIIDFAFLT